MSLTPADSSRSLSPKVSALLIVAAVLLAFWPALSCGFIWDDEAHVTKPELQSVGGLGRIWFELGATQQHYPLLHSLFWVEHRLWGDAPFGYHLANLLLHTIAALLVYANLRRLQIPGALLATLVFAVHPVQVETVAWVTEQKNTLSAVFYFAAMWFYLRFDADRKRGDYAAAIALFVLGLLSKTVTATLPAALLVIFWWQRGTLSWRRDILPLLPWFLLGAVAGLFTAWVEHTLIGAHGEAYEMSLLQRCLLAGRVPWFYLSNLIWPANLNFVYPHWVIDPSELWQWTFPAATTAVLVVLLLLRNCWRGPLAGALLYLGTLFPVLGFLNVYPFQYSYVADHFQYLASLAAIVPVAAGATLAWLHFMPGAKTLGTVLAGAYVLALALVSARQCFTYRDLETLYTTTTERNPDAWLAYLNLGVERDKAGRLPEAADLYRQVLRIKPDHADAHANLGDALVAMGETQQGLAQLERAIELAPDNSQHHYRYGLALLRARRPDDAAKALAESARLFPGSGKIQNNLGVALFSAGKFSESFAAFGRAIELDPQFPDAYENLMSTLAQAGPTPEAVAAAQRASATARTAGQFAAADRLEGWLRRVQATAPPR